MTPTDDAIRIVRHFEAPPARLFEAWADAERYRRWAWGDLGLDTAATVDCRAVAGEAPVAQDRTYVAREVDVHRLRAERQRPDHARQGSHRRRWYQAWPHPTARNVTGIPAMLTRAAPSVL